MSSIMIAKVFSLFAVIIGIGLAYVALTTPGYRFFEIVGSGILLGWFGRELLQG